MKWQQSISLLLSIGIPPYKTLQDILISFYGCVWLCSFPLCSTAAAAKRVEELLLNTKLSINLFFFRFPSALNIIENISGVYDEQAEIPHFKIRGAPLQQNIMKMQVWKKISINTWARLRNGFWTGGKISRAFGWGRDIRFLGRFSSKQQILLLSEVQPKCVNAICQNMTLHAHYFQGREKKEWS